MLIFHEERLNKWLKKFNQPQATAMLESEYQKMDNCSGLESDYTPAKSLSPES